MNGMKGNSVVWASPGSVCLKFDEERLQLTILTCGAVFLDGQMPKSTFGHTGGYGIVTGTVLGGPTAPCAL
ncbi:hypothetical protein RvY_18455 [Ramazzottius varieornatus]|uniref:Uncharacterized protein n=1 Tax=Ramazzottius varieornatus TaxID=947166 RepID=A0A1D1W689_RAMVA|nr:hypothetical protein RvY_18455 [Ramazzottius varieornatus]